MSNFQAIPWTELFQSHEATDFVLPLRVVSRRRQPFLILPARTHIAHKALALYPAQSTLAKIFKNGLSAALKLKLPISLKKIDLPICREDSFSQFLMGFVKTNADIFPNIAILIGNGSTAGRRFVILVFNEKDEPAYVVKAGLGDTARQLIQHEKSFLQSVPKTVSGLPKVQGEFDSQSVTAFVTTYIEGTSPVGSPWKTIGELLQSWIDHKNLVQIEETVAFRALNKKGPAHPAYPRMRSALHDFEMHPVLFHGDFAPWNIKVHQNTWHVLDWERGELEGIAGWDWFHYATMTGILVQKLPTENLLAKLNQLLGDFSFKKYAAAAGFQEKVPELFIAYLFYLTEVIQPGEGLSSAKKLLNAACEKWLEKN